jgi:hypothetical protein
MLKKILIITGVIISISLSVAVYNVNVRSNLKQQSSDLQTTIQEQQQRDALTKQLRTNRVIDDDSDRASGIQSGRLNAAKAKIKAQQAADAN